jgi:excinuclease ABC subunit A
MARHILLENVRTHNLKGITCRIPRNRLTVVTGVSGSGKSSLAFDTLYAEGQRRYTESLSTYARQFLERMPRPELDRVAAIPPAIAIEQVNRVQNARSTVGTATEILDYLRLLFCAAGSTVCPDCGEAARCHTPNDAVRRLGELPPGTRLVLTAPASRGKAAVKAWVEELIRAGYRRLLRRGEVVEAASWAAEGKFPRQVDVVVDRVVVGKTGRGRMVSSLEEAFLLGKGVARAHAVDSPGTKPLEFHQALTCPACSRGFAPPVPALLSFNSPAGACPECHGFGRVPGFDQRTVMPDPSRSLAGGAVAPFELPSRRRWRTRMLKAAQEAGVPTDVPWSELSSSEREWVWNGSGKFPGVNGFFRKLERKRYRMHVRVLLARYRSFFVCPSCDGARLQPDALQVQVGDRNLSALCALPIPHLREFLDTVFVRAADRERCGRLLEELHHRLVTLEEVGLGYLTLDRQTRTLSGGECQRINLAASLGSALTETLYVLDEPTVGLHARDVERLLGVLRRLVDLGNTVVVIEHERDVMVRADHILELGPGAGHLGGELIFEGTPEELAGAQTATGQIWSPSPERAARRRRPKAGAIVVRGASENNLKLPQARFPLQRLVCVTGLSGSGKTTLVRRVLHDGFRRMCGEPLDELPGACRSIEGTDAVDDMVLVDQSPLGRSSRSNPVTYVKAFAGIRQLLASTPEARRGRMKASHFSFNVRGGRCEGCGGAGTVTVEMHFLADLQVTCDDCGGARFMSRALAVRYRGRNVGDILEMTADEAAAFFADHPALVRKLEPLRSVGLGYLRLGQPTLTLSGGEAQRLKLAGHLAGRSGGGRRLFLLDEPTTGLHPRDVDVLMQVFERLLDDGHSLVVIEHNPDVIARADHILDLGPGGGHEGGRLVVAGTPEKVMACKESWTGQALKRRATSPPRTGSRRRGSASPARRGSASSAPPFAGPRGGSPRTRRG